MKKLLLISGPSCSGKTFLANYLANKLGIPLIAKDSVKERFFDSTKISKKTSGQKFEDLASTESYKLAEKYLNLEDNIIFEANFKAELDKPKIEKLCQMYNCQILELHCTAPFKTLFKRFTARAVSPERHPGHRDRESLKNATLFLNPNYHHTIFNEFSIEINTNDFSEVDYEALTLKVVRFLK